LDALRVAGTREAPEGSRDRDVDVAVDVAYLDDGRAPLPDALGLHHADHPAPALADGERGPERVDVAEQLLFQLGAEHADPLAVPDVEGREEASVADVEVRHVLMLRARADHLGDTLARPEAHFLVQELEGGDTHQA